MGEIRKRYLIIDWGFTRLKLWSLNQDKKLTNEKYFFIKDLNPHPEFYLQKSLKKIAQEINIFLKEIIESSEEVFVLSSCQMHCLAGILENGEPFLSTWNDMPNKYKDGKIYIKNGQPTLLSMPINKILIKDKKYYLSTKNIKEIFMKDEIKVQNFMTPFQLIFNYFFNLETPASIQFWESTCLPKKMINEKINKKNKFSDSFIEIKNSNLINFQNSIKIFPEIGDLQATTYSSLTISDIVINWGTGSQIIFKGSLKSKGAFYRNYPNVGKVSVISHIPCGRIFSDYCKNTKYTFKDLIEAFDSLNNDIFKKYISDDATLLYFPGFDAQQFKYLNNVYTSIKKVSSYSPIKLICLWLNQYIKIIDLIDNNLIKNSKIRVTICGDLGGISTKAIEFLKETYSYRYSLILSKEKVPNSLIKCLEDKN